MKFKNVICSTFFVASITAAIIVSVGMVKSGTEERNIIDTSVEKSNSCSFQSFESFLTDSNNEIEIISDNPFDAKDINWAHPLTESEFQVACCIVMGESGGECYEGQLAVAQCIRNGCDKEKVEPSELRTLYKYAGYKEEYSKSVEDAVVQAFRDGEGVTDEEILFFYNPSICNSKWHESLNHVITIGNHKFFSVS